MSDEIADIESSIADTKGGAYWHDSAMQDRYAELLESEASGEPAPARNDARKAEIERMMTDTRGEYWSGPNANRLQAEYAALIDGDLGNFDDLPPVERGVAIMEQEGWDIEEAQEFADLYEVDVEAFAAGVADIRAFEQGLADELGEDIAQDLQESYAAEVPLEVRQAAEREFFEPLETYTPLSHEGLIRFGNLSHGRILMAEWRDLTKHKVGIVEARLARIRERVCAENYQILHDYILRLPVSERAAVFRAMAR